MVAPVLHELAGQLHRVPLDVADPRRRPVVDAGEHVLQAVPELVEEGLHLVEGHQRGPAVHRGRPVAHQVGHREAHRVLRVAEQAVASDDLAHPGAPALLGRTAVGVQVEGGQLAAALLAHAEEADVLVPHRHLAVGGDDLDPEEPVGQGEQALQDPRQREVGPQLLVGVVEAALAQALGPVGQVPVHQLVGLGGAALAGEVAQLLELPLGRRPGGRAQLLHQVLGRLHAGGHLADQRELGGGGVPQDPGHLAAQLQDALDQGRVVELARAGAGHVGSVQLFAQLAPSAVLHEGQEAGHVQGDPPGAVLGRGPLLARLAGGLRGELPQARRKALDLALLAQGQGEGRGRVQDVVAEGRGQLRQLELDRVEALARLALEPHAGELDVPDHALDDPALDTVQLLPARAMPQLHQRAVDRLRLRRPHRDPHDLGLGPLVGLAQLLAVLHAHQVGHHAPGQRDRILDALEGLDQPLPGGPGLLLDPRQLGLQLLHQAEHGGLDVLGPDPVEARGAGHLEQGVLRRAGRGLVHVRVSGGGEGGRF